MRSPVIGEYAEVGRDLSLGCERGRVLAMTRNERENIVRDETVDQLCRFRSGEPYSQSHRCDR